MRKALKRPIRAASSDTKRAPGERVASGGVDADDLVLDLLGLAGEQLLQLRIAHDLRVVFQNVCDVLLVGRGQDVAGLGLVGEGDRERGEQDRARDGQPEREAEGPGRGVDASGLADPLLGDRGEGVVLSCDTSSPSPAPASTRGMARYQPLSALGTSGIRMSRASVSAANPARMMLLGLRLPALLPASSATPNIVSDSGASDTPASQRVVAQHQLQVDRQGDQEASQRDLLQDALEDPEAEQLGREQRRVEQRRLAVALAADEPEHQGDQRRHPNRKQRRDRLAALLPDQDAEHDAPHAEDREQRADPIHSASPV